MLAFGLSDAAGNFVHDIALGEVQRHYIIGGLPGETVTVELVQFNPAHEPYLTRHNCGKRMFDEDGKLLFMTSCTTPSHISDQDVYSVTWRGMEYIFTITYVDNSNDLFE